MTGDEFDHETIRNCLERILASDSFARSPQAKRFLEYIVGQTLEGEGRALKAYTIGVAALGVNNERSRPETTARMQASRVRRLLEKYYQVEGIDDPLKLELPTGSYQPRFARHLQIAPPESTTVARCPTVLVSEFESLSSAPEDVTFCRGLLESIVGHLVRADDLRVTRQGGGRGHFVLAGTLTRSGPTVRFVSTLANPEGETIWSQKYDRTVDGVDLLAVQDDLAWRIINQVGDPSVGAVSRGSRNVTRTGPGSAALQAFYRYLAGPTTAALQATKALLEEALSSESSAALHAAHSCVLSLHYLGAPSSRGADLLSAESQARAASSADSECALAHLAKALVHYHHREKTCVEREARRSAELSPASPIVRAISGNLLCLVGAWQRGLELTSEAQDVAPQLPGYLHFGRCLYHLHQRGEAALALPLVDLLDLEGSLLSSLLRAACLIHLGRRAAARQAIGRLASHDRASGRRLPRQLSDLFLDPGLSATLLSAARDAGLSIRGESAHPQARYSVARNQRPVSQEIRVGILHSLSGTMSICETHLVNAAMLAIDEINSAGGVLGRPLRGIVADGASDPEIFRKHAEKLIVTDQVSSIFGCWTSSSRKAVLPVVERHNSLLWYPVQYEGLEGSRNVIYTGSCLNQQIEPAIRWATKQELKRCFLVGSDYVFPRTANRLIRGLVEATGGRVLGERYQPLGGGDFEEIAEQIKSERPDIVYNTVNGSDNIALLRALREAGVTPTQSPLMSFSLSELELAQAGSLAQGHYACWSYFQSMDTPENQALVARFRGRYGETEVLSDPMVTAYAQVHLFRDVVTRAGEVQTEAILSHLPGGRMDLGGELLEVVENNHVQRGAMIGKARHDQQFDILWYSNRQIAPQPWLGVDEADFLTRDLVLGALRALPEMAEQNASLEGQMARLLS